MRRNAFDAYSDRKTTAVCKGHDLHPLAALGFSNASPPFFAGAKLPSIKHSATSSLPLLDDIGYVQQNRDEMEVLFTFFAQRYERRSVIITSNLVFSQWDRIFKDPMTTAAAVDRLVHHSIILELNGKSIRKEEANQIPTTKKTDAKMVTASGSGCAQAEPATGRPGQFGL